MTESPRRTSLFGGLRLVKTRRESRGSPGQSNWTESEEQTERVVSRRLTVSGLWGSFRSRSKSDGESAPTSRPLFVDTSLANRQPERCWDTKLCFIQTDFLGGSITHSLVTAPMNNQDTVYVEFMKVHKCYDLMPISGKVVVFHPDPPVKKALSALVRNGTKWALLWDDGERRYAGLLTVTDLVRILHHHRPDGARLDRDTIATWRELLAERGLIRRMVCVEPGENLLNAVGYLCKAEVHRLPVMAILTHRRILRFLYIYMRDLPEPSFLVKTPEELGVGSWKGILTVELETSVMRALGLFNENRISVLPVLNDTGAVVDVFAKSDMISLVADSSDAYLELTIGQALDRRVRWSEWAIGCSRTDSMGEVIKRLARTQARAVLIVDGQQRLLGLVSLSDLLKCLVMGNCALTRSD